MKSFSLALPTLLFISLTTATLSGQMPRQNPFDVTLQYNVKAAKESGHPDFVLPSIEDPSRSIQLSDYRGQKVLLLHFASW